ncbi:MAG TPA: single-stranded DNA-binding protein [Streptosporangiaceae bacterium]|nr:single-stranded DNA-binding protein [Streptosporangiaceae bacterium]
MFNEAQVSMTGYVATQPRWRGLGTPSPNVTMRVAWTPRRLDRATGEWADGHTSYVSVFCWRKLAENAATCLRKGDPVVVKGRLTVRDYNDKDGAVRTAVEVDASSVGHDLSRGVAQFQRTRPATGQTADEYAAETCSQAGARADDCAAASDDQAAEPAAAIAGVSASPDIFDQEAIGALAAQPDGVSVPF